MRILSFLGPAWWLSHSRTKARRLIPRIDHREASDVVGQLKETAASVLAGGDALEACFDAGDAYFAQGAYGSGGGIRLGTVALPVGNTLGNPGPEERGQVWQGWT